MSIIPQFERWEPFHDLTNLRQKMDQLMTKFSPTITTANEPYYADRWVPTTDVIETKDALFFKAELPGMKEEDVIVEYENGMLTISGERKVEFEKKEQDYHRMERSYGKFQRAFSLPNNVDPTKITASFNNGLLEVEIPKKEEAKAKKIKFDIKKKLSA